VSHPLSVIARDLSRLLTVNILTRAVGIAALVFYARMLSPADLAALPVFLILGAFTTLLFNFGLYPTLMREVPVLLEQRRDAALGMIRTVVITITAGILVSGVGYLLLAPRIAELFFHDPQKAWLVRWMIAGAVARGADEILTCVLRATREVGLLARKRLISDLAQPVLVIALIPPLGVRGLVLGSTIGILLGLGWGLYAARNYLFRPTRAVSPLPLIRRSKPFYVEGVVFFLTQQGDQALVGALLTPPVLAAYYIARRVSDALTLLLYAVEEIMGPALARASLGGRDHLVQTFKGFVVAVAALVLPAAAIAACLAPAYVTLIGPDRYAGLAPTVAILALGIIPMGVITVVSQAALALGHPTDRLKITSCYAGLLLAFTALAAPSGTTAIALGRTAALLVAAIAGAWLARELLPPVPWRDVGKLALPTLALAVTLAGLQLVSGQLWFIPIYLVAAGAIFIAMLNVTLGPEDRARLLTALMPQGTS
jgi:O-antigen/teichoic acid export membrane protein